MNMLGIAAGAVCISIIALSVKNMNREIGQMITITAVLAVLAAVIPYIVKVIASIKELSSYSSMGERYLEPILKITGIAYISQIGAELCSDSGEKALASRVEMAGKIAIGAITIPIAREAFEKIIGILT